MHNEYEQEIPLNNLLADHNEFEDIFEYLAVLRNHFCLKTI